MGKRSELISYNKTPVLHEQVHTPPVQQNAAASTSCNGNGNDNGKGKAKVEHKKKCGDSSRCDGDSDDERSVSRKEKKKAHKPEAYVPPKGVDEAICRDRYCKIHRRSGIRDFVTNEAREKAHSTFEQMPHLHHGMSYGRQASYHPSMFAPEYGAYPPAWMNDYNSYPNDENPRTCHTM